MTKFKFGNIEDFNKNTNSYLSIIRAGIGTKRDLLETYSKVLKFPDYFGYNWDALDECLSDFHWIEDTKNIVIYHKNLPQIGEKDIKTFLSVLNRNAGEGPGGSLTVIFPEKYREEIEAHAPKI